MEVERNKYKSPHGRIDISTKDSQQEQVLFFARKCWPQDVPLGRDSHHTGRDEINHTSLDERAPGSQVLAAQMSRVHRPEEFHPGHQHSTYSAAGFAPVDAAL